jgi:hypothetical protein
MQELDACVEAPLPTGGRYPRVRVGGRTVQLSRVVYCEHNGKVLDEIRGLVVRHKCDNTACINPNHLVIGTQKDNANDRESRHRGKRPNNTGELNGQAKLTQADVEYIRMMYRRGSAVFGRFALAEKYGVSLGTITKITKGTAWRTPTG